MSIITKDKLTASPQQGLRDSAQLGQTMQQAAGAILRYGLVGILLWIGLFKFTSTEAHNVMPLISHSPFLSWMELAFGVQKSSDIIGVSEIVIGLLIATRFFSPLVCFAGSIGGILTFLTTLSFLFSTPMTVVHTQGLWGPSDTGGFLVKDVFLLGAALWSAGEAWTAYQTSLAGKGIHPSGAAGGQLLP